MTRNEIMRFIAIALSIVAVTCLLPLVVQGQPSRDHVLLVVSPQTLHIFKANGSTLTPAATVPIGTRDREVCISADGDRAYATNDAEGTVTVVDLKKLAGIGTIDLAGLKRPDGCATSPDSKKLYVAVMEANAVAVISLETNKVIKQVKVGDEPRRILFTPDHRQIFVSSEDGNEISILDAATDEVTSTMKSGGQGPRTMLILPDNQTMLVTNVNDDTLSFFKIPYDHPYMTIGAGGSPQRIALSPDGQSAYVLAVLEQKISIIDLKGPHVRAKKFAPVGKAPWGMDISDDHRVLFVGNTGDDTVVAYDTATMQPVATVTVKSPRGLAYR